MSENVESGIADDVTETPAAAGAEGQEGIADEEKNDGGIADLPKETPPGESEKEPEAPPQAEKLAELTVKQLRQKAEERGIVGVEALSKAELLEIMEES